MVMGNAVTTDERLETDAGCRKSSEKDVRIVAGGVRTITGDPVEGEGTRIYAGNTLGEFHLSESLQLRE